jgi:hypothetical protein
MPHVINRTIIVKLLFEIQVLENPGFIEDYFTYDFQLKLVFIPVLVEIS